MPKKDKSSLSSYDSPQELAAAPDLTNEEKCEMLRRWKNDLDSRLVAESEGMSNTEPMTQSKEGSLADRLKAVDKVLEDLCGDDDVATETKI
ncbi:MAG: hypothetical protein QUV08_04675 [Parasphingorhabdus sp.]|nr:hypothetical protein [Parasphingorhabdus sp.]|tara:strand:+ start:36526 stop:36801 length:276 start_codon:yes stop_codon:yes gene_type:complete